MIKPERQQVLARVAERLAAIHKNWAWLTTELNESPQNINNWCKHRGIPTAKYAAVAKLLGWSVEQLLGKESKDESGWPFHNIPPHRFFGLSPGRRLEAEGALMEKLDELEGPAKGKKISRPVADRTQPKQAARPGPNRKTAT